MSQETWSLTILRNGGWEQWFRNLLLVQFQIRNDWGFTEAHENEIRRADLILRCKDCCQVQLAVEAKINFVRQGPTEINSRLNDAMQQIRPFTVNETPSFIVYILTHLRGQKDAPLVSAQQLSTPWYKHFDIKRKKWPIDRYEDSLPDDTHVHCDIARGDDVAAEVSAWAIEAVGDAANPERPILHFLDGKGKRILTRATAPPEPPAQ